MAQSQADYLSYRRTWRSRVRRSLEGCRLKFRFGLSLFEEEYCLDLFGFLIALPFLDRWHRQPREIMEKWGFYLSGNGRWPWDWEAFVWCWGDSTKFFHFPWKFTHINDAHQVQRADGSWAKYVGSWERDKEPDGRHEFTLPFHYTLKNGTVQERLATIHVERREWRRKWTRWLPLFAKKSQYIWVSFNDEVGEGTGSWKGGTIGCGWHMKPGETAEQAFRRMERERTFD